MAFFRNALVVAGLAGASACSVVVGIDSFRACQDAECIPTTMMPEGGVEAGPDVVETTCAASADCAAPTPVCSGGKCRSIAKLVRGVSVHTCLLVSDGSMWCFGSNEFGELGNGLITSTPNGATQVIADVNGTPMLGIIDAGTGFDFTCFMNELGGKRRIYCMGTNKDGRLGTGSAIDTPSLLPVEVKLPTSATTPIQLSVGPYGACVLMSDKAAYCWGRNNGGELGGTQPEAGKSEYRTPQLLTPLPPKAIQKLATGGVATCAIYDSKSVQCWGDGWLGLMADGNPPDQGTNFPMSRYPWSHNAFDIASTANLDTIEVAEEEACVRAGTEMWCWGGNYYGMADGMATSGQAPRVKFPAPIALPAVVSANAGYRASCALVISGQGECWGQNDHGSV